jgi:hypothetical protein
MDLKETGWGGVECFMWIRIEGRRNYKEGGEGYFHVNFAQFAN